VNFAEQRAGTLDEAKIGRDPMWSVVRCVELEQLGQFG
jgi:hypothetical protein